jgi:8-oxo-dGTP pyrophosphatase MutT (NUDIX family)
MYIKIYFGDKPVFLCDKMEGALEEYRRHPDTFFMDEVSGPAIKSLLHEITRTDFHTGILLHPDLEFLKKAFWKHFTIVKAAGGLVENESGDLLLIFRRGKWDLPKGKLEKDESLEECAVREVQEETGLRRIELQEFLLTTYHTYNDYGHSILKESFWYRMQASGSEVLIPQTIEDIHEIKWVSPGNLAPYLDNTFPSIRDVLGMNRRPMG